MTGLPAANSTWPPKPHDVVLDACRERQAWWTGDPDLLRQYYGGGQYGHDTTSRNRSRAKRAWDAWWGRTPATANAPKKLHIPVAADIGRIAASTLFSDPVTFVAAEKEQQAVQDAIDATLNTDETYSRLLVAAESSSMLSGVYGRIVWDTEVDPEHSWIDYVDADRAIPEFRWGRLTAVTFWTELDHDGGDELVLRHVERYSRGIIEHALYEGTRDNIGKPAPLTEHARTAGLAEHLRDGNIIDLGVDELGAGYFPNMRPNPQWRNEPDLRHLGRSDLTVDVIRLLDAIDETWSSWMRDLDLGKGRIIVSESLLTSGRPGSGSTWDSDQAVFSPVGQTIKDGEVTSLIQAEQFAIRVEEHRATFEALLRQAIARVGYSPITFGLSDEVAMTATEVDSKERDTNATRSARIRLWAGLSRLATTQLRVDAALFGGAAPSEPIEVEWPDSHQESPRQIADTVEVLNRANAASIETRVRMVNPDWDDKEIQAEVDRIQDETSAPVSILGPGESTFGEPADDPNADPEADPEADEQPTLPEPPK